MDRPCGRALAATDLLLAVLIFLQRYDATPYNLFSFFCSPGGNGHVKPLLCPTLMQEQLSVSCLTEHTI